MESEKDTFLEMLSKEIEVDGNKYKYVDYTAEGGNISETIDINTTKTILSKTNNKDKIIEQLENTIKYENDGYISLMPDHKEEKKSVFSKFKLPHKKQGK